MSPWIEAARPKTLSAGLVPVLVGSAAAYSEDAFSFWIFLSCLIGAISIQIATNYINDGSDFLRGADTEDRQGPKRMAQAGIISPRDLFTGAAISFGIACIAGAVLVQNVGLPILWVGIISIVCAIAYTAGPFPLAYYGLGDLFVFIFFGLVAVGGTFFSHTKDLNIFVLIAGAIIGLLGVAIIVVNNTRDISTDIVVKKRTMAVQMGNRASRIYYGAIVFFAYIMLVPLVLNFGWKFAIPFLSLPLALMNVHKMWKAHGGDDFNSLLANSAMLQVIFGLLLSVAFIWI